MKHNILNWFKTVQVMLTVVLVGAYRSSCLVSLLYKNLSCRLIEWLLKCTGYVCRRAQSEPKKGSSSYKVYELYRYAHWKMRGLRNLERRLLLTFSLGPPLESMANWRALYFPQLWSWNHQIVRQGCKWHPLKQSVTFFKSNTLEKRVSMKSRLLKLALLTICCQAVCAFD